MKFTHKADSRSARDAAQALGGLFEVAALLTGPMDEGIAAHGLSRARAEVIWRLHHLGPVTQRELSEALRCTPRNVTGLVDALEESGLVARAAHPTDRLLPDLVPPRRGEEDRRGHGAPDLDQHDDEAGPHAPVPPVPERVPKHALHVLAGVGRRASRRSPSRVLGIDRAHPNDPRRRERPPSRAPLHFSGRRQPPRPDRGRGSAPPPRRSGRDDLGLHRFPFAAAASLQPHRLERRFLPRRAVVPEDRGLRGGRLELPPVPRRERVFRRLRRLRRLDRRPGALSRKGRGDRRARRVRQLRTSRALASAAEAHARALGLAGAFTHDWPLTPRSPFEHWITRYYGAPRRKPWSAGENLLWAYPNLKAEDALAIWLGSPSHRKILVARYWREIGVSVIRAENAAGVFGGRTVYIAAAEFGAR